MKQNYHAGFYIKSIGFKPKFKVKWSFHLFFILILFGWQVSLGTASGGYTLTNCAAGANYFEFQLNLTNTSTAGEVLYLVAPGTVRINHGAGIVPAGTNTYSFQYIAGSADASVAPLYATLGVTYNTAYTASSRLMQFTFSTTILGNSAAAVNCPIQPGATVNCGKYRLTITNTNFVAGANVGMTWVTTSGFVAYVNTSTTSTAFNTSTNRTLGTPCAITIPSSCTAPTLSSIVTNSSCSNLSDGSINLTASNGSPAPTFAWSGPNGFTATSEDISGLAAGSYTVTATSGSCTASGTYIVNAGPSPTNNTTTASACDSYTWSVNGTTYTQSGSYTSTGTCSEDVLNLTITSSTTNTTTASACDSYTWSVNGNTYTQSGTYSSVSGCSTEALVLTINPSTSNTNTETATSFYTWSVNGQTYTQTGTYSSVTGCTTEILNLTISTTCTPTSQPTIACYEAATWNTVTCQWDVTGTQPAQPSIACYETATFNGTTCQWDVTGTQPSQPSIACYETATFNGTTCSWDVTGSQPAQPSIACYETANFNGTTCQWDVTGTQPSQPSIACYETATFNGTTCQWDVTGSQPAQPSIACYETATFNGTICQWDVIGTQPSQPSIACYETASFNSSTCQWDVTGSAAAPIVTTESVCDSYTWAQNGQTYTTSGTYSSNSNCQDYVLNLTVSTTVTYYADSDGDGYGSNTLTSSNCTGLAPAGYISTSGDCNDNNASVKPGATELCNSIDDDCDGLVDDNPLPVVTGTISGTSISCRPRLDGTAAFALVGATPGATSVWSVPSGFSIISGQGTSNINISYTASAIDAGISGPLCMNITDACGSSTSVCTNIDYQITAPVTPPSISGPSKPCPGDTVTYSISTVARATSYSWTMPAGASLISGQGSNIIQVGFGAGFTGGFISVIASNSCGSSAARSKSLMFAGGPPTPSSITGIKFGLCNSLNIAYSIAAVPGASSYLWALSGGGTITSGQGTTSITVDFTSFTSGYVNVQSVSGCGASLVRSMYIVGAPGRPEAISGSTSVCKNATEAYGISSLYGTALNGYNWTVSSAGLITSGQGTKNITVLWNNTASAQGINVNGSNACGTGPNNAKGNITVSACPRNGQSDAGIQMELYPNPAYDRTHVVFNAAGEDKYNLRMTDMAGRTVISKTGTTSSGRNEFDVYFSAVQAGVYFIEIQTERNYAKMRLVVAD